MPEQCRCGHKNIRHPCKADTRTLLNDLNARINVPESEDDPEPSNIGRADVPIDEITPVTSAQPAPLMIAPAQPEPSMAAPTPPVDIAVQQENTPKGAHIVEYVPGPVFTMCGIKGGSYDYTKFIGNQDIGMLKTVKADYPEIVSHDLIDRELFNFLIQNKWASGYTDRNRLLDHMQKLAGIYLANCKKTLATYTDLELNRHLTTIQLATDEVSSAYLYSHVPHQHNVKLNFVQKLVKFVFDRFAC